jgi:Tat protein secretion system quality control protein TatD with DNase activity
LDSPSGTAVGCTGLGGYSINIFYQELVWRESLHPGLLLSEKAPDGQGQSEKHIGISALPFVHQIRASLRDAEAAQLTKLLGYPSVTALGEVGLDLSEGTGVKLAQMESLGWVLSLAPATT